MTDNKTLVEIINNLDGVADSVKANVYEEFVAHKGLNEPSSILCERYLYKHNAPECSLVGIDIYKFRKLAQELSDNPDAYISIINKTIIEKKDDICKYILSKNKGKSPAALSKLTQNHMALIANTLDAVYTFSNCKRFVYQINMDSPVNLMGNIPDTISNKYDIFSEYSNIEDMIIDFKLNNGQYSNICVRILTSKNEIYNNKNWERQTALNLTYLSYHDNAEYLLSQITVPEKKCNNGLLINSCGTDIECQQCKRCVKSNLIITSQVEGRTCDFSGCYMTKKKLAEGACIASLLEPYKVLSLAAYIQDMYSHRHTIERKNSIRKATYSNNPVSTIINHAAEKDGNATYNVIDLQKLYKYEQEHKEWQGGHHKSPVEHERRATTRRIWNKDGSLKKIVSVKGCKVNKGKGKGIYLIK